MNCFSLIVAVERKVEKLIYCQDWDKDMSGGITVDQMREIFRIYKVISNPFQIIINLTKPKLVLNYDNGDNSV